MILSMIMQDNFIKIADINCNESTALCVDCNYSILPYGLDGVSMDQWKYPVTLLKEI